METKNCKIQYTFPITTSLTILILISNIQPSFSTTNTTTTTTKAYTKFIKTECNSTLYPTVCYKTLSSYASNIKANPINLCNTSLSITLASAKNISDTITKVGKKIGLSSSEISIVGDCVDNIKDSIEELKESLDEMGYLGRSDAEFHMANMKTWVSAALTDMDTCTDGFDGRKVSNFVKSKIRNSVVNLAQMISNTLALINRLTH